MNRRRFIALTGVSMGALAGCTSEDPENVSSDPTSKKAAKETETTVKDTAKKQAATPTPTPTTETTTLSPTPTPTPTPIPEPKPQKFTGTGSTATKKFSIEGGMTAFHFKHDGERNFIVKLMGTSGGEKYLANEIGTWEGYHPANIPAGEYILDVDADGAWNIEITQPRPTTDDVQSLPFAWTGAFPKYAGPFEFSGLTRVKASYSGDSNFIVYVLDIDGNQYKLLFNEIGKTSGSTAFSANGHGWIWVNATGDWQLNVTSE